MFKGNDEYYCVRPQKPYKNRPKFIFKRLRMDGIDFKGKKVLITGAASGIGIELAIRLSRLGACLGLVSRSKRRLSRLVEQCSKEHGELLLIKGNLTHKESIEQVVFDFLGYYSGIDVLINCVGNYAYNTIETTSMKEYDKLMNLNLRGVFHLIMTCMPELISAKGCIVCIAATEGLRPIPNCLVFSITQSAIIQLCRTIAAIYGPQGVRSYVVNPSCVDTKFSKAKGMRCAQYITFMRNVRKLHPLRKVGKIQDMVNMIMYVASRNGKFLTGNRINITGGFHITPITKEIYDVFLFPMN